MKLIVGLGNPGGEYVDTRHNAGFFVVDELQKSKLPKDFVVKKSDTFMNESGDFVAEKIKNLKLKIENLYIVHDDLDIKLGEYKIQFGKGPKDHNGLKSIDEALGTSEYWHVRIGVDNRPFDNKIPGETYVLQNFSDIEKQKLGDEIRKACKELVTLLKSTN
jgi:peptidyl-tRNA hydrolase, PTH1 family